MAEHSDWQRRLEPLLSALTEGALDEAGCAALDDILRTEPEARRIYARYLFVHAALSWKHRGAIAAPPDFLPTAEVEAPCAAVSTPTPVAAAQKSWRGLVRDFVEQPLAAAALALVLIAGSVLAWQFASTSPPPVAQQPVAPPSVDLPDPRAPHRRGAAAAEAPSPAVIARITRSIDASWASEMPSAEDLCAGRKLELAAGVAEIVFDSGARLIVEGPVELVLGGEKADQPGAASQNHNACQLTLGKLVANVPQSAHGFIVHTPNMKIVDWGTEFGVRVQRTAFDAPRTEVQVFQGTIAIERPSVVVAQGPVAAKVEQPQTALPHSKPQVLEAGQAVTSDGGDPPRATKADPSGFVRQVPGRPRPRALTTWPKDSPLQPGDIVAVTFKSLKVLKIDPETGVQQLLVQGRPYDSGQHDHGVSWHCVAVAPDGTLVVGIDGLNGRHAGVLRIDPKQRTIKVLASGGLLTMGQVSGVAVAADGTIYAVYQAALHNQPEHVLRVEPVNGTVTSIARLDKAFGICLTGKGHDALLTSDRTLAVSLMHDGTITPWVSDTRPGRCLSAAVAPDGQVVVTAESIPDLGERRILEVARSKGHETHTVATLPPTLNGKLRTGIWNMGVEFDGSLIVSPSEQDLHIYRLNPKTGKSVIVSSGELLEGRTAVAIVPAAAAPSDRTPQK